MSNIINIKNYTDALRNTGYRNVESAIAEIVDNSLEADASDVLIVCSLDSSSGRRGVEEIAILDNGIGMDIETLEKCLVIGESTRRSRKGMGRFGVGLPQASLHVSPRVEVYSWQKCGDIRLVYLDIEAIKSGKQENVGYEDLAEIPAKYRKYMTNFNFKGKKMDFSESGTLVIWKNCDRLRPRTVAPLFDRFKFLLGRKFRYFVHEGKHNIGLTVCESSEYDELLKPNDPLCIMNDNMILGDLNDPKQIRGDGEPIFEYWENGDVCGEVNLKIPYLDKGGNKKNGTVTVKFSWAKSDFHQAGGESQIGKFIKKNVGVSIVRAGREIDFGKFDFFSDVNEPQHRWWGCEVSFEPELDEVFGVANNKQQVELFELDGDDYIDEEIKPVWFTLNDLINKEISNIFKALKARKKGTRAAVKKTTEEQIVANVEKDNNTTTASSHFKKETSTEDLLKLAKENLVDNGIPDPSEEELKEALSVPVKIQYKDLGDNSTFIEVNSKMGNTWLTINTGSIFYRDLYSKLENYDESVKRALNLILMAYARAEDEAYNNKTLYESFHDVREQWGIKLRKYLKTDYQA
ncbi:ATP-binding protein [Bacteriovorax sp. Seq25_V]|uniref:ATP-binding protein n=1 Tax=Bacteriovorax sp. Seq25_V TaxID=1201288 RepID=UPI00038A2B31|nr:ATP-binding protein [Bacteriovorax sp. Seq25_V]EQC47288.1 GHKL domain protein [Bacteriovorax sp. Seq25_V]